MPLVQSASKKAVSENISREMHAGKPQKQAIAIALDTQRRNRHAAGGGIGSEVARTDTARIADDPGLTAQALRLLRRGNSAVDREMPIDPSKRTRDRMENIGGYFYPYEVDNYERGGGIGSEETYEEGFGSGGHSRRVHRKAVAHHHEKHEHKIYDIPFKGGLVNTSGAGRTDQVPLRVPTNSHVLTADVISGMGQGNTKNGAHAAMKALRLGPATGPQLRNPFKQAGLLKMPQLPTMYDRYPKRAEGGDSGDDDETPVLVAGGEMIIPREDWVAKDPEDGQYYRHAGVRRVGLGDLKSGHDYLDNLMKNVRKHTIEFLETAPPPKKKDGGPVLPIYARAA